MSDTTDPFTCSVLHRISVSKIRLNETPLTVGQVVELLNKTVDLTRDGWPVQKHDICYCWDCSNPDDGGHIPLPLSYGSTTSKPMPDKDWRRAKS